MSATNSHTYRICRWPSRCFDFADTGTFSLKCHHEQCSPGFILNWQPKGGLWKLSKHTSHLPEFFGACNRPGCQGVTSSKRCCALARTTQQILRSIFDYVWDPNITSHTIDKMVIEMNINNHQILQSHYQAVRMEIILFFNGFRAVDMALLGAYANLLRACRHRNIIFPLMVQI